MDEDNGRSNASRFWREPSSDSDSENSASSIENSPFRGFEKEAMIKIPKFNADGLLSTPSLKTKKFRRKSLSGASKTIPQLVSSCFVKLVSEDLEQLKKDFLKNSRLSKVKTKGILIMPSLQCEICGKAYSSEKKLQNHLEKKHMLVYKAEITKTQKRVSFSDHVIVHELKEYHRCRKCTRIFEEYKSLKSHMKHEHRKRKCYICNYCSKNFVDRMIFKVHIKLHCEVCGLLLPNKREYLMHRRGSCRIIKKYTCKTCDNKFFSYMDLKDHSYDHFEDLFVCDICKSQHSSKCAISHHILFLHSEIGNRPKELFTSRNLGKEKLYLCNFCEVSSLDKNIVDNHVSVLPDLNNRKRTGYKDYYFCDQCLMKFDTESSMLQHKWSHFLNTSENLQVPKVRKKAPEKSKRIFKINEKLPFSLLQPKIVLERINLKPVRLESGSSILESLLLEKNEVQENENIESKKTIDPMEIKEVDLIANNSEPISQESQDKVGSTISDVIDLTTQETPNGFDLQRNEIGVVMKKAIVDPKSKKTLISKFQCKKCHKYYSSNYCLNRHIMAVHQAYSNLQCPMCEETFVWPSLLKSHKCIRMNIPEMPFDDARPEIQIDNYRNFGQGMDELMNLSENADYMNSVDFEIPAPIVELTEYENNVINPNVSPVNQQIASNFGLPVHNKYKIVMQEVPIEF